MLYVYTPKLTGLFFLALSWKKVFLGNNGVRDVENNELPRLVYVSREKRPGFDHHKKAGAMNSLVNNYA